jgi:hypothetical protein
MRKLVLLRIFSRERVFGILRHLCHLILPHCGHGEVECDVEAGGRKWIERLRLWPWRTIAWTKEMSTCFIYPIHSYNWLFLYPTIPLNIC